MKRLLIGLTLFAALLLAPIPAGAYSGPFNKMAACTQGVSNFLGLQSWDACLKAKNGSTKIEHINDVWLIVFPIVEDAIKLAGYLAVIFIIWGGIQYIKSQGEPQAISGARETIQNAVIGLLICIFSVAIIQFVVRSF